MPLGHLVKKISLFIHFSDKTPTSYDEAYSAILPTLLNKANFFNFFKESMEQIEKLFLTEGLISEEKLQEFRDSPDLNLCDVTIGKKLFFFFFVILQTDGVFSI